MVVQASADASSGALQQGLSTAALLAFASSQSGDVLINNTGYGQMGALEDVPMEAGRRQMEVNLIGVSRLTQLCPPHIRA